MAKDYKHLGDYIEKCEGRNSQGLYGEDDVLGVNNEGKIVKSKAKLHGVDLSPYKVVKNNNFVYNPARLDLGSVSLYKGDGCVVSTLYVVFKVRDDKKEELLTDYLDLWLKRKEFHRYVGYINWGSAREYFWYDNIAEILLPVPPIEEQRRIVAEYQTVERRIKNNEALIQKLEETAQAIYHHTFVEGIDENNLPEGWRMGCLGDLGDVIGGATPNTDIADYWVENGISWLSPADMPRNVMFIDKTVRHITQEAYNSASTKLLPIGTVLFSSRAPIGLTAITCIELCTNQGYKSIVPFENIGSYYVYFTLLKEKDKIANQQEGSTFAEISGKELSAYPSLIPACEVIKIFNNQVDSICTFRRNIERELTHLRKLQSLLTSKLA